MAAKAETLDKPYLHYDTNPVHNYVNSFCGEFYRLRPKSPSGQYYHLLGWIESKHPEYHYRYSKDIGDFVLEFNSEEERTAFILKWA